MTREELVQVLMSDRFRWERYPATGWRAYDTKRSNSLWRYAYRIGMVDNCDYVGWRFGGHRGLLWRKLPREFRNILETVAKFRLEQ